MEKGDGITTDTATGKRINGKKPEEPVRQQYEKILHDEYGYDYDLMDIEVPIKRGSRKIRGQDDYADIVIYDSKDQHRREQHKNILGIVETKKPERKDGLKQLQSYMSAASCRWGVWTNGKEIEYVYKDPTSGELKTDFIFQIPRYGEGFEDLGKKTKDGLVPAASLKVQFGRMLNTLYTNTNISRREKLGNELIRIIFCKIWDEKYYPNQLPKFRVGFGEDLNAVKARIDELFNDVKDELVSDGVFEKNERITLEPKSVAYVVGELENYSLLNTNRDVVGDAFEVFAESKLVGEKGEFFTPREVVKTAIEIVKPKPEDTICDPACGSGGFLIHALEHVWSVMDNDVKYRGVKDLDAIKKDVSKRCFYGIDKEMDLVKIAKAHMAIVGDGRGQIVQQNTLHRSDEFEGKAKSIFVENEKFKKFTTIITNPPFGSKIKVLKEDAQYFELGNKHSKAGKHIPKDTAPQELFIERCLEMLEDEGTLAIVLPETYFHAVTKRPILEFMLRNNNVKAIVDLPHDTFRPHNNAKTILIVLEKNKEQQEEIMMAVIEGIGHDALGRELYRYDIESHEITGERWDDSVTVRDELKDPNDPSNRYVFTVKTSDIKNNIYIPRYYWDKGIVQLAEEHKCDLVSMGRLSDEGIIKYYDGHGSPKSEHKGKGKIPYIRVSDIVNWDMYTNYTSMVPESEYERVKGNKVDLKPGDVLFVSRGSYRIGTVAMFLRGDDPKKLLTREIKILRITKKDNDYSLTPEYLIYLLSSDLAQMQMAHLTFVDTTLPNIGVRWKEICLPIPRDPEDINAIKGDMNYIFKAKQSVLKSIANVKTKYGNLTT